MIDIWMIFCMLNPFCEVFIHALRHTLKNTAWTNQVSTQGKELDTHLKKRMVVLVVVGGSLLVLALLFLVVYWAVALHHYFAVSSTSMATSAEQSCIYQFV